MHITKNTIHCEPENSVCIHIFELKWIDTIECPKCEPGYLIKKNCVKAWNAFDGKRREKNIISKDGWKMEEKHTKNEHTSRERIDLNASGWSKVSTLGKAKIGGQCKQQNSFEHWWWVKVVESDKNINGITNISEHSSRCPNVKVFLYLFRFVFLFSFFFVRQSVVVIFVFLLLLMESVLMPLLCIKITQALRIKE